MRQVLAFIFILVTVMMVMTGVGNAVQIAAVDYIGQNNVGIWQWAVRADANATIEYWWGYCLEKDKPVYVYDMTFPNSGDQLLWNDGYSLLAYTGSEKPPSLIDVNAPLDASHDNAMFAGVQTNIWLDNSTGSYATGNFFRLDSATLQDWIVYQPATSVPEPSTLMLLGFGLIGIGVGARKTFKNK